MGPKGGSNAIALSISTHLSKGLQCGVIQEKIFYEDFLFKLLHMPLIEDHHYLKICAQLASSLSISISAARRKVEVAAAKEGKKDLQSRKEIAQKVLDQTIEQDADQTKSASASFDQLLKALKEEENFMLED